MPAPARDAIESLDYQRIFDSSLDYILLLDSRGVLLDCNPHAFAFAGRALRDCIGRPLAECAWWSARRNASARVRGAVRLAAGGGCARHDEEVLGDDGAGPVIVDLGYFPVLDDGGHVTQILVQGRDVTARHRYEEPLRESEKLLREITETIHEVFWMTNSRGDELLYVSPGYETIWGRSVESLYRNTASFLEVIHPQDRSRVVAGLVKQMRGTHVEKFRVLHSDGTVRWVRTQAFPVRNEQGEVYRVTGIATDITEQVQAREEVQRLNRELEGRIAERTRELTAEIAERGRVEEVLRARSEHILVHRDALLDLARLDKSDFPEALHQILKTAAETLAVERMSYWILAQDYSAIICEMLYLRSGGDLDSTAAGIALARADYPRYFDAVSGDRPIVAHRADRDDATSEFADTYLGSRGITSMMDVPVWFHGRVVGVICHEHVGAPRNWTLEEVDFATSVATMISLALETSNRQRLLSALQKSEEKYRKVVENANEGIIVLQDGFVRFANAKAVEFAGRSAEEVYSTPFQEMAHPEDRAMIIDNYTKRMRGEPAPDEYEFRTIDPAGRMRWLSVRAVKTEWEGRPGGLNFLTDITRRKELEDELSHTLSQREAILRSTLVGITFTIHRRHVWLNGKLAHMLGYRVDELIGQSSLIHFPDEQAWLDFGAVGYAALARGEAYIAETQMKRKDGAFIWCQVYGEAIDPDDLGKGTIWTFIDITDQKRAQEETRRALEKERELNELKSRFVSMTSHEFRTPLATILSSVELLQDYGDRLPAAEKTELMGHVKASVTRMTQMLDDVLVIGKADAGRFQFNPAPCDPRAFCLALLDELRRATSGSHELAFSHRGDEAVRLLDVQILRHVLSNLVGNAIKYSPRGELVRLELDCRDDATVFAVIDRGIGIPDDDRTRLFETFTRGRNVANISGTGLGLAIVKRLVSLHGGTIGVESRVGHGSRFTVSFPLVTGRAHG